MTVGGAAQPALAVTDAAIRLGRVPVLKGIDLSVTAGQVVALLGANGSGKTTLVRGLLGLLPLETGEVRLFGQPLERFSQWERVGYVPQRFTATTGVPATVLEVVRSGRVPRAARWLPFARGDVTAARSAVQLVGLDGLEGRSVARLSGGQQRRVLIARALAGEPEALVLDEPLAGLDLESQSALADTVRTLKRDGLAVLLIEHALGPLEPLIDRAVVLAEGRIVYDGPPAAGRVHASHGHHHPGEGDTRPRR